MLNLIRADLYKLRKSNYIKVLFGMSIVSAIIMMLIASAMTKGEVGSDIGGIGSLFTDFQMIALLGSVVAASYICGDFENKSINDAIVCGLSRCNIVISKAIIFILSIAVLLLPYSVVAIIGFCNGGNYQAFLPSVFLNIMANVSNLSFSLPVLGKMLLVFFTIVCVYASQLSVCIMLGFTIRKPILVIAIAYGLNFLGGQSTMLTGDSLIKKALSLTPFGVDYSKLLLEANADVFVRNIIVSLVFILVILVITCFLFKKAEVK